jgi:hypothetical protein
VRGLYSPKFKAQLRNVDAIDAIWYNQPAYHGSPHIFDKFSLHAMGTGEGAQAYGWGLYFAGKKEVAKWYRDTLARTHSFSTLTPEQNAAVQNGIARRIRENPNHADEANYYRREFAQRITEEEAALPGAIQPHVVGERIQRLRETVSALDALIASNDYTATQDGRLYTVEIPEDDTYLLWNKPLDEQIPSLRENLKDALSRLWPDQDVDELGEYHGADLYKLIVAYASENPLPGVPDEITERSPEEATSRYLASFGFNGIKFLDGTSRKQGEGSYNYVIFDDKLVEIRDYEQRQQGADAPRGRIVVGESSMNIELLKNANLSTFLHETGHFYLEVLSALAADPNAPTELSLDLLSIRGWLGAKDGEKFTRAQHEQFARGFEAYLLEGKAPSQELRSAFAKFRAWLVGIYRSVAGLSVHLTPEVSRVFDRLLATDDELDAAEHEAGIAPLFGDTAALGMTEAEGERYTAAVQRARRSAEEELTTKVLADLTREQRAWWKAEREKVRGDVAAEVEAEPITRALAMLQRGTLPNGEALPAGVPAIKLSRAALVAEFGDAVLKALPRPYTYAKEGGVSAEDAALVFGFESGHALINALAAAEKTQPRIDRLTDARMKELHGDLLTDGTLPEAALRAVHNEDRAKLLRVELQHLASGELASAKGLLRRLSRRIPTIETVRDNAERVIAVKKVRDITPALYQRAEAKAARTAMESFLKGDIEAAFEAKQRELLNHELYRAASTAREEVESIVAFMQSFDKPSKRARLGKAGGSYLDQIDALRDRYSFRRLSTVAVDKRASLLAFAMQVRQEGESLDLPEHLLLEAQQQHYKDTPMEELRGVRDAVQQIAHLAGVKNKLLASARARSLEEARTELVAEAAAHFDLTLEPKDWAPSLGAKVKQGMRRALAVHTRMEFLFRHLDGHQPNGVWWSYFFKPMAEAEDAENTMRRTDAEAIKGIMAAYTRKERAEWFAKKIQVPGVGTAKTKNVFTKSTILAIALNWGNAYNRDALMEGYGWTEGQVERILAHLDARDWHTVQAIWDHIDTHWAAASALEKEVTGLAPEKVEALEVKTAHGVFRGGYYPIAFDREQSSKQLALDLAASPSEMAKGYNGRAMTRHGHLKERTSTGGKPLTLELSVISQHLSGVTHDLAFRRAIIDVSKLMRDPEITHAIEGAVGREMYAQLPAWLSNIAGDRSVESANGLERIATKARAGGSAVALGFNMVSSVVQTLGFLNTINEVGVTYAMRGVRAAYANPAKIAEQWQFITERSPSMRDRMGNFDREVRDIARSPSDVGVLGVDPSILYSFIGAMDMGVSIPSWLGAYEKAMDGKLENIDAGDEHAAIDYADSVVRTSQAAGAAKDMASVQQGSQWQKLFVAFYSSMSVLFNQFAAAGQEFAMTKDVPKLVASMALLWFVPAVLEDTIRGRGPDDDDDKLAWAARKILLYPLGTVVILRDIANLLDRAAETGRPGSSSTAVSQMMESLATTIANAPDLVTGEAKRAAYREAANTVGYFAKLPTRQMWKTGEYFYRWWTGDVDPSSPVAALWGAIHGPPSK